MCRISFILFLMVTFFCISAVYTLAKWMRDMAITDMIKSL